MMFERCYTSREQPGAEHGLGYSVVMDMVVMLNRTNTQGFFNNYFTSVPLVKNLKLLGIQHVALSVPTGRTCLLRLCLEETDDNCPDMNSRSLSGMSCFFVNWQDTKPV